MEQRAREGNNEEIARETKRRSFLFFFWREINRNPRYTGRPITTPPLLPKYRRACVIQQNLCWTTLRTPKYLYHEENIPNGVAFLSLFPLLKKKTKSLACIKAWLQTHLIYIAWKRRNVKMETKRAPAMMNVMVNFVSLAERYKEKKWKEKSYNVVLMINIDIHQEIKSNSLWNLFRWFRLVHFPLI